MTVREKYTGGSILLLRPSVMLLRQPRNKKHVFLAPQYTAKKRLHTTHIQKLCDQLESFLFCSSITVFLQLGRSHSPTMLSIYTSISHPYHVSLPFYTISIYSSSIEKVLILFLSSSLYIILPLRSPTLQQTFKHRAYEEHYFSHTCMCEYLISTRNEFCLCLVL